MGGKGWKTLDDAIKESGFDFRRCVNCGGIPPHYVPPSLGEPGFFGCKKGEPVDQHFKPIVRKPDDQA